MLTDAGLARLRAASRTHLRGIADHFLDVARRSELAKMGGRCARSPSGPEPRARRVLRPESDGRAIADARGARPPRTRHERLRLSGLGATVLSGRAQGDGLLAHYAERLRAVELNNTFYQQPSAAKVATWLAATPADVPVLGQGPARRVVPGDGGDPGASSRG